MGRKINSTSGKFSVLERHVSDKVPSLRRLPQPQAVLRQELHSLPSLSHAAISHSSANQDSGSIASTSHHTESNQSNDQQSNPGEDDYIERRNRAPSIRHIRAPDHTYRPGLASQQIKVIFKASCLRFSLQPTCCFAQYANARLPAGYESRQDTYGRTYYLNHVARPTNWNRPPIQYSSLNLDNDQRNLLQRLRTVSDYARLEIINNETVYEWGFSIYVQAYNISWPNSIDNHRFDPPTEASNEVVVEQSQREATSIVLGNIKA